MVIPPFDVYSNRHNAEPPRPHAKHPLEKTVKKILVSLLVMLLAGCGKGDINSLRRAAERGDAKAQTILGVCYAIGKDVEKDEKAAADWFRKAAEQGYPVAQYHLGRCYANGQGVEKDEKEAAMWMKKARQQGMWTGD